MLFCIKVYDTTIHVIALRVSSSFLYIYACVYVHECIALAKILHCQHVAGDATECVGRDLSDVGMINNFPAKEDTE